MTLSSDSTRQLADTIAPAVFEYLSDDGRYMDGIMNSIEGAIVHVCGKVDPELVGELGVLIMDKIGIVDDTPCYEEVWRRRYETLYTYVKKHYAESYVDGAEYDPYTGYEATN